MTQQVIDGILNLRKRLTSERLYWFSKTSYKDFFVEKGLSYELDLDKWSALFPKPCSSGAEAIVQLRQMLNEYHHLPFWHRWWWFLTRPMSVYQRLHELHSLHRLEYLIRKKAPHVMEVYEESQLTPNWIDRLFGTWRMTLYRLMRHIDARLVCFNPEVPASTHKTSSAKDFQYYMQMILQEELENEEGSLKTLVDCYELINKSSLSQNERRCIENKIWLRIHPDRNAYRQEEAKIQTQRFQLLRANSRHQFFYNPTMHEFDPNTFSTKYRDVRFEMQNDMKGLEAKLSEWFQAKLKAQKEEIEAKEKAEWTEIKMKTKAEWAEFKAEFQAQLKAQKEDMEAFKSQVYAQFFRNAPSMPSSTDAPNVFHGLG